MIAKASNAMAVASKWFWVSPVTPVMTPAWSARRTSGADQALPAKRRAAIVSAASVGVRRTSAQNELVGNSSALAAKTNAGISHPFTRPNAADAYQDRAKRASSILTGHGMPVAT